MPEWARTHSWELLLGAILLATVVYNATNSPVYLDVDNFVNLFRLSIEKVIIAVAMTFVIINGEIDLSVASVMAFSACVLASAHEAGVPFPLAIVLALAAAAAARVRPGPGGGPDRHLVAGRDAGRADRLPGGGAHPARGPLDRRLPRLVRRPRPRRLPRDRCPSPWWCSS